MSEIVVRAFEQPDLPALHRVYSLPDVVRETLEDPYASIDERSRRFSNSENTRILVAELDDEPAGFGDLSLFSRRRVHAARIGLAVDPERSGMGVGSTLMQALIDLGEGWYGVRRFELMVFTENSRAIDLYRRFGFEIEVTHRQIALRDGEYADAYSMARLRERSG